MADESSSTPPYLMMDLGYSIAMFVFAMIGMRYTMMNVFGIDLFDFRTMPAQIAGGVVGVLTLFSIYRLVSDPKRVHRLGRKITGRQYAMDSMRQQAERADEAVREAKQVRASLGNTDGINSIGRGFDIAV